MTPLNHMLSSSSFPSKNNRGTRQKWWGNKGIIIIVVGSMSLLNMALSAFVSGWGHRISFQICLHGFGLSILTIHLLLVLSSWPLIVWHQILPNPLLCHRYVQEKLTSAEYSTSLWYLTQNMIFLLCLVSMMWETLWPTFDQDHFLSTSAHYPGRWPRDSLQVPWSLHASMAGSSCSMRGFHHWPPIGWFYGCSTPAHWFTRRGLYL